MDGKWNYNTDGQSDLSSIETMAHKDFQGSAGLTTGIYDIVGMDVTKVDSAIEVMRDYIATIEGRLRDLSEGSNINLSIKSEAIQKGLKDYMDKLEEYCANLTSQLTMFCDRLEGAREAWNQVVQGNVDDLSTHTSSYDVGTHRS